MAATDYTYSISTDTATGAVDASGLQSEIAASSIVTAVDFVSTDDDVLTVWMKAAVSAEDKTTLDGLVAAHTGEVPDEDAPMVVDFQTSTKNDEGKLVTAPTFEDVQGLAPQWEAYLYTATAGAINIFDELVTTEKKIRGGWYEIMDGSSPIIGDEVEFAVVDKDDTLGLFSTYGLTVGQDVLELRKYVKSECVNPGGIGRQMFQGQSAFTVVAGLYMRSIYDSTGETDVQFKVVMLSYE